ncbi:MAG: hypothetical protein IPM56_10930 [Ignavibacteriales bacterium]|nr:MAG: hypothetical protein IPM56_10930 [Ignavibacteriales bacterium]
MKEIKQFSQTEAAQLWADLYKIDLSNYSIEVSPPNTYFREYSYYPQNNFWEWFVLPGELIYKPIFKIILKPSLLKNYSPTKKLLLFCSRTIVPLRI